MWPDEDPLQQPAMQEIINPAPVVKAPPATPEEFEQRKAGWMSVLENLNQRIQSDPNTRTVLMMMGLRALQGKRPGQSTVQALGETAGIGFMTDQMLDQNQYARDMAERKMQREEAESKARVGESEARTSRARQEMEFAAQEQPEKLAKLQRDAKVSALKLREAELQTAVQEAIARKDPTGEMRAKAALDKVQLELKNLGSQIAAHAASAKASTALANMREAETNYRNTLADPNAPQEAKDAALMALGGASQGRGGTSAMVLNRQDLAKHYAKVLDKPVDSKEVSEAVIAHERTEKLKTLKSEYAEFLKNWGGSEEAGWQAFKNMQKRFGVDLDQMFGGTDTGVPGQNTGFNNWRVRQK